MNVISMLESEIARTPRPSLPMIHIPVCLSASGRPELELRNFRTLIAMTTGIILHENGSVPYGAAVIAEGVQRALA